MDHDVDGWTTLFKRANQLLRATTHPAVVQLPVEARMPSLDSATGWLNSPPLTPAGLRGKVVLVDFWTFTCINWLRTLPYLRAWADKYKDHGLVVIGVHTPEFHVEHDLDNVRRATKGLRVDYPVATDNDYARVRIAGRRPRNRRRRPGQRHGHRTTPVPTHPPARPHQRPQLRDHLPRPWRPSLAFTFG